jgi:hypothetical protein
MTGVGKACEFCNERVVAEPKIAILVNGFTASIEVTS